MSVAPGNLPLRRGEKLLLVLFGLALLGFAAWIEVRSCFMNHRHTDFTVYVRAAWAARTGQDMYAIEDEHQWHYCYPPPFALALIPLADPPEGESRVGYVPFWVAMGIWIAISTLAAVWTVHVLARAVLPEAVPWSRRWTYARSVPLALSMGGVGFSISHGQVNTAVAALIAGAFAAAVIGRRFTSGVWLAAAAALKITPGLLVLYPLLRRDGRSLAGVAVGSVVLLLLFPAAFFGFQGAIAENRKVFDQVLAPGATGTGDQTRADELTKTLATDSSSFQAVIHTWRNPQPYWQRPTEADRTTRLAHWAVSGLMLSITALVLWRNRNAGPADQLPMLGALVLVMILMSPVSHVHHFAMALPALCGLWLKGLKERPGQNRPAWPAILPLVLWALAIGVLSLPGLTFMELREFGLGTSVTVLLWAVSLATVVWKPARETRATAGSAISGYRSWVPASLLGTR